MPTSPNQEDSQPNEVGKSHMPRPGCSLPALLTPLPREEATLVRKRLGRLWRILTVESRTYKSRTYHLAVSAPSTLLREFYFGPRVLFVFEPYDTHTPEAIELALSLIDQERGPQWERQTFFLVSRDACVAEKVSRYVRENRLKKIVVAMSYQELSSDSAGVQFRRIEDHLYAPRAGSL